MNTPSAEGLSRPGGYAELLRVAYPLIISMGSFTLMQFCDRMFLAWHSAISIQAALPAGILSFTLVCGFMALAGYANTFVAQYHGAGDRENCSRATAQGVFLSLLSAPALFALIPAGVAMLRLSGHGPAVLDEEIAYFVILMYGAVASPLGAAISSFFAGRGDTRTTMLANLAGNAVNIVLDYAMIFGRWGLPEMGIRGAAWATVIAGFIAPAILFAVYLAEPWRTRYGTRRLFRPDRALMSRMIRFGFPSAAHLVLDVGSFTLFVLLVGRLGPAALAASNIAFSINNIAFMPLIGLSIAASILVGQYQGRGDSRVAERSGWTALKVGWFYMGVIALSFVLFPRLYLGLFAGRGPGSLPLADLLPVGRILLVMMAAWGMLDAVNVILSGALKGAGDTRFVMYYSVLMGWCVWIVGEAALLRFFGGRLFHLWAWLTVYVWILAAGFFWRYRSGAWKKIELIERQTPLQPNRPGAEALVVAE